MNSGAGELPHIVKLLAYNNLSSLVVMPKKTPLTPWQMMLLEVFCLLSLLLNLTFICTESTKSQILQQNKTVKNYFITTNPDAKYFTNPEQQMETTVVLHCNTAPFAKQIHHNRRITWYRTESQLPICTGILLRICHDKHQFPGQKFVNACTRHAPDKLKGTSANLYQNLVLNKPKTWHTRVGFKNKDFNCKPPYHDGWGVTALPFTSQRN